MAGYTCQRGEDGEYVEGEEKLGKKNCPAYSPLSPLVLTLSTLSPFKDLHLTCGRRRLSTVE